MNAIKIYNENPLLLFFFLPVTPTSTTCNFYAIAKPPYFSTKYPSLSYMITIKIQKIAIIKEKKKINSYKINPKILKNKENFLFVIISNSWWAECKIITKILFSSIIESTLLYKLIKLKNHNKLIAKLRENNLKY